MMNTQLDVLIATLGGSPDAVKNAVDHYSPKKCFFVCTRDSVVNLAAGGYDGKRGDGHLVLESKEDVGKIIHDCIAKLREWFGPMTDISATKTIIDITGGTKAMSAGLATVGLQLGLNINYTGGDQRSAGGMGIVEGSPVYYVIPPFVPEIAEEQLWEKMRLYAWETASENVEHAIKSLSLSRFSDAEALQRKFEAIKYLILACRAWDHFEHQYAKDYLERSKNRFMELKFADNTCRAVIDNSEKALSFLGRVGIGESRDDDNKTAKNITPFKCADLYFNAARRYAAGKYDDAALRLYRSVEMTSQFSLGKKGIDSSSVSAEQIPQEFREEYAGKYSSNRENKLQVSLQGQIRLLEKIDPACGLVGWIRDKKKEFADIQTARNYSILAHGLEPIGKPACQKFLGYVESLMRAMVKLEPFQDPMAQLLHWR